MVLPTPFPPPITARRVPLPSNHCFTSKQCFAIEAVTNTLSSSAWRCWFLCLHQKSIDELIRLDSFPFIQRDLVIFLARELACFALDAFAPKRFYEVLQFMISAAFLALLARSWSRIKPEASRSTRSYLGKHATRRKSISAMCAYIQSSGSVSCEMMIIVHYAGLALRQIQLIVWMSKLLVGSSRAGYLGLRTVPVPISTQFQPGATCCIRPRSETLLRYLLGSRMSQRLSAV